MKIEGNIQPKSSFLSMEKDASLISNMLLRNERLKKLLYYTTPDCLDRKILTEDQSLELFGKNIKLVPKLFNHDGSISTPYPLAMSMVEDQLSKCKENDLTKLKILDPNAGSGTFLISAFDYLRGRKEAILKRKLTFNETKSIITDQLFEIGRAHV